MDHRRQSVWCVVAVVIVSSFAGSALFAEPVNLMQIRQAADTFLTARAGHPAKASGKLSIASAKGFGAAGLTTAGTRELRDGDGTLLAYVTDLEPRGFVVLSADTDITPIIAYSFRSRFPDGQEEKHPLYRMLREDMRQRIRALAEHPGLKSVETGRLWDFYVGLAAGEPNNGTFQQWPAEGTTSTGGWLETAWDQSAPYNQFCPLDAVDRTRTYTGCVATAVAQVVNYHHLYSFSFSDSDSYTAYSGMQIDADSALYDFPSFDELNAHLGAVRDKYSQGIDLNDTDAAVLSFACGVAVQMDHSSKGSGANVSTARDALVSKLGFRAADMFGGLSIDSSRVLQENIINRQPALISVQPPDGFGGHIVVCDGYNTDDEYHLNFGWGSDHPDEIGEVWYHLQSDFSSYEYVVGETILNIRSAKSVLDVDPASMSFSSAPGEESAFQTLHLVNTVTGVEVNSVTSPDGFVITRAGDEYFSRLGSFKLQRVGFGATIRVKFRPQREGGYYGTLAIQYGDGCVKYVILRGWSYTGGTEIAGGDVSGVWSRAASPYFVKGNVQVPENGELTIEPGVKVFFVGRYGLTVGASARMVACGEAAAPIEFTAWNRDCGWTGLRFIDSGDDDVLSYCSITFARKGAGLISPETGDAGPAEDTDGGAIYCAVSDPTIENCKIANNMGEMAGGLYCVESSPVISNTLIANNASVGGYQQSGGICCGQGGVAELRNCTIVRNSPGGIFAVSWDGLNVTNTIVWGNDEYQIQTNECSPTVSFCDVQGGYRGEGNMDVDPCFFDPSAGAGTQYDGMLANWALQSSSPCVNSGKQVEGLAATDLAGAGRIHSDIIDVGAYENQSDLSLMTISPPFTIDAGFVPIDGNSVVQVAIRNTGTADFNMVSMEISDGNEAFSLLTAVAGQVLSPGSSVQAEIVFRPQREGSFTGMLTVRSTADNGTFRQLELRGVGVSGKIVPGGSVSGAWKKAQSPYVVTGDIRIPKGKMLTIEPGVVVKFAGRFGLTVGYKGILRAIGAEQDNIVFTAMDTDKGWYGIRFINSGADDVLEHCTIEYSKKPRDEGGGYLNLYGGAILCCTSEDEEPGFPVSSSPMIDSCLIAHNHASIGGAIMCMDESEAIIIGNTIEDNSADMEGAGIFLYYAYCTVANNVIARNSALVGGGIMNLLGCPSIINNTIVRNRPSALYIEITDLYGWGLESCVITNNIIWDNEIYMSDLVEAGEYEIRFNDIQGGWDEPDNIDLDPCFADPAGGDYHLKSQAGRWDPGAGDWAVDEVTSPCIDAGDPDSDVAEEPEPNGQRINMGAYGGTDKASKSPSQ
jgi:parallel beta-helix repeat protein